MDLVEKTETRARTSRTYSEQLWPLWLRHVRRDLKRATGRRIVSRVVTVVRRKRAYCTARTTRATGCAVLAVPIESRV